MESITHDNTITISISRHHRFCVYHDINCYLSQRIRCWYPIPLPDNVQQSTVGLVKEKSDAQKARAADMLSFRIDWRYGVDTVTMAMYILPNMPDDSRNERTKRRTDECQRIICNTCKSNRHGLPSTAGEKKNKVHIVRKSV